jgi:hypothetical protein
VPNADRVRIAVDGRIELFSILCRLAGNREYNRAFASSYVTAVDTYFAPFKDDPAVQATRALHQKLGISFNAPLTLAVHLDDRLQPIAPLSPLPPGLDERFANAPLADYLTQVRRFAERTRFTAFLHTQSSYFGRVEQRFREFMADKPIVSWFDATFGKRSRASYLVVPGLLTGPMNYGLRAIGRDGTEHIVQVMNLEGMDAGGLPHPAEMTQALLAHELAHTYVNPIIESHFTSLRTVVEPAFDKVREAMSRQAYSNPTIMTDESVVRAVTLLYLNDRAGADAARRSLAEQERLSFLWTYDLSRSLDAVRKHNGGHLSADELADTTRSVFATWDQQHLH